jgi:repressor LexA|tara:strand:+ start:928 stop:1521 length:594 start_codon:yes stop_codon:yes gene_type:complete
VKLTARQAEVLELIKRHIEESGMPPTRADIAKELGFKSANAAEEHLRALARKGAIEMIAGASRGIRLPESNGIPIVGYVAAGYPVLAEEHVDDYCDIAPSFFSPRADFFLRVRGESMQDVGIMEGDLLAVHKTHEANSGDIVVARVDDEMTVKRLHKTRSKHLINLEPENPAFNTIEVDLREQEFTIEGISVGVIRR